jgi:hypothetical protein
MAMREELSVREGGDGRGGDKKAEKETERGMDGKRTERTDSKEAKLRKGGRVDPAEEVGGRKRHREGAHLHPPPPPPHRRFPYFPSFRY